MDRLTKATLWVAFLVLGSYFVWFFVDCAMDDTCHIVCRFGGRGGCYTQRQPDSKDNVSGVTREGTKNNPTGSHPTNFTDGTMKGVY
jgi:hypothetical protein